MIYLIDSERCAFTFPNGFPFNSRAIMFNTCDVHLPLAGDAFLDVDDPQRLISTQMNSGDLIIRHL
jgi:hypothetical protein